MRSPYDPPSASGGEPHPELVRIDARSADYDAVIGPRADYYRPRFEDFDANGARLSWNWPAFFVTTIWFVYRGMWRMGAINLGPSGTDIDAEYLPFLCQDIDEEAEWPQ